MSSLPATLGKYQIIREIARSNDIVYEAYDPLMNRRVALKELNFPRGLTDQQADERISRFRREAQAVGTLAHPNIMTVFEYGQEGERHYMAMEYLDGHTLRNELDSKGFIPVSEAVRIAESVLKGLLHAHSKGVIHRDIKPDNVQLLTSGEVKITDFGIARLTFQPNLTMDGQVFGTPSYMSPEQVVGKELDQRSDLFSVGVMLYEMVAGHKPFQGDNVVSITHAIMNTEPAMPAQAARPLQEVIRRALEKTASLRFSSASDMLAALENAMQPQPFDTLPNLSATTALPPLPQPWPTPGAPFNPYAQAGFVPTQAAPPQMSYPYNPYATGQVGSPHTGLPPGFQQIPVYYPPPPRPPLFKPETKRTMTLVFYALLILGSLVAIVLGLIAWLARNPPNFGPAASPEVRRTVATPLPVGAPRSVGEQSEPVRPVSNPAIEPLPDRTVAASTDEIQQAFRRMKRDHPEPGEAEIRQGRAMLRQLGDRDAELAAEIRTYVGD